MRRCSEVPLRLVLIVFSYLNFCCSIGIQVGRSRHALASAMTFLDFKLNIHKKMPAFLHDVLIEFPCKMEFNTKFWNFVHCNGILKRHKMSKNSISIDFYRFSNSVYFDVYSIDFFDQILQQQFLNEEDKPRGNFSPCSSKWNFDRPKLSKGAIFEIFKSV